MLLMMVRDFPLKLSSHRLGSPRLMAPQVTGWLLRVISHWPAWESHWDEASDVDESVRRVAMLSSVRHAHEGRMGDTASCAWRTLLNIATLRTDSSTSLASSQWLSQAGQ